MQAPVAIFVIVCELISCKLFPSLGNATIQYSPNLPSSPSPPHSPGTGTDTPLNSVTMVAGSVGMPGQDGVQVLVDSGGTTPGMLVQGPNRGRGRGGRGGRGRGGGRGRRSTSGPPPEIDHNIEVKVLSLVVAHDILTKIDIPPRRSKTYDEHWKVGKLFSKLNSGDKGMSIIVYSNDLFIQSNP